MSASTSSQSNVTKRPEGWYNFCRHCERRYWARSADIGKTRVPRFTDETCQQKHECPPGTVRKHRKVDPTVGAIYAEESEVPMSDPSAEQTAEVEVGDIDDGLVITDEVIADAEDAVVAELERVDWESVEAVEAVEPETPTVAEQPEPKAKKSKWVSQGIPRRKWTPEEDAYLLELNPTLKEIKETVAPKLERGWDPVYQHLLILKSRKAK